MRSKHVAFILFLLPSTVFAAERVRIHFDVPSGLEQYSGHQPVTFGVPFERGLLFRSHGVRVVDSAGRVLPAQFEVTATWGPESSQIRWFLVDLLVEIRNGHAPQAFLEFGPDVPKTRAKTDLKAQTLDGEVVLDTGTLKFTLGRQRSLGQYALTDGTGNVYRAGGGDGTLETTLEKAGPVRAVVRSTGDYVAEDGSRIAQFVTRERFYANCPFVRVFHTMIWLADANTQIGRLSFHSEAGVENCQAMAGVDGKRVGLSQSTVLAQTDWNTVQGSGNGKHLDGWIQVSNDKASMFASLRWPWQQFPTGLSAPGGHIELQLIGPEKPMSLKAEDVAVEYVRSQMKTWNLRVFDDQGLWSMKYNGPETRPHVSPRGVARTYEMLLWYETDSPVTPEQMNILAQHPVLAYADPAFATRANLPSPMSPRDPDRFPVMESALDRAFDWYTRERAFDGDFGTWNFGDVQWAWIGRGGYTTYRYWMNHGKGWSILPWALWLRSGDRKYWKNGEINSRHVMDVDTCHVPEWKIAADGKVRGGQYHYSAIHWGYGPQVSTFYVDSEYLPYCYYVTGYERARDVMLEHAEALARDDWRARVEHFKAEPGSRSRHMYAVVKDLAALYEATWDERLLAHLQAYLDLMLDAQLENGKFLNITSNHYLDQPLLIAARALPDQKPRILNALKKWHEFIGDPVRARTGSSGAGPVSLWTMYALAKETGEPHYVDMAGQVARARAWCVADGEGDWRGLSRFEAHLAGPTLRDWPAAMAALAELPSQQSAAKLAPLRYFNAQLPVSEADTKAGCRGRHVVLVLDSEDRPIRLDLHFMMHNQGTKKPVRVRVFAPDGNRVADEMHFAEASKTDPTAVQGFAVDVPVDRHKGVYAFEIWSKQGALPTSAVSSTGKLVHYMPPGRRVMCSPIWGGQAWFEPEGDAEVLIGDPHNFPQARIVAFAPDGKVVGTNRITETVQSKTWLGLRQLPKGEPCRFEPAPKTTGLYSFVCSSFDWHGFHELRGMKPFIASRKEEWFDATQHPCPDLRRLEEPSETTTWPE